MDPWAAVSFVLGLSLALWLVRGRRRRSALENVNGPKSDSWLFGHMRELILHIPQGSFEFEWLERFGAVYRIKGCLGQDRLVVADPLALKTTVSHMDVFERSPQQQRLAHVLLGQKSLFAVTGSEHRKLRGMYAPVFSAQAVKEMGDIMQMHADKMVSHLRRQVKERTEMAGDLELHDLIQDGSLDAIAQTVVGMDFEALGDGNKPFVRNYKNLITMAATRSSMALVVDRVLPFIPDCITGLHALLPKTLRRHWDLVEELAQDVHRTDGALKELAKDLNPHEMASQVSTILMAGHDTTSNALSWCMYELARHPEWQARVREEVGDTTDLGNAECLNAHLKEVLRMYPGLPFSERVATQDAVLRLSEPVVGRDGTPIGEIEVKKGQFLVLAHSSYNRNPAIWGADAHLFRAERWLGDRELKGTAIGPYANLMSFLGGPRTCIGWRWALAALQILIAELVRNFEFRSGGQGVYPCVATTLMPSNERGQSSLPLEVKAL